MRLSITNVFEFVHCVYDFVCDEYSIEPREFDAKILLGPEAPAHQLCTDAQRDTSLLYNYETDRIERYECRAYDKRVHVHRDVDRSRFVVCCSQPDTVALRYIVGSVHHPLKREILERMHEWLPSATLRYVRTSFGGPAVDEYRIDSYFEPSYLVRHADADEPATSPHVVRYRYFKSHIDTSLSADYVLRTNTKVIMVRARSPSPTARGRSPSPSGIKKKSRKSQRSQSPTIIILDPLPYGSTKIAKRRSKSPGAAKKKKSASKGSKSSRSRSPSTKKSGKGSRARSPAKK